MGFKRSISWNKYLPKPELLAKNANLNRLTEPSFQGVNRLFVLAFEDDAQRISDKRYYIPNVEIKDYHVMIEGKNFFDQPVKNDKVTYENVRKIATGQGDDYATGCLLDYIYFKSYYKMIAVDLSKQQALDADPKATQQINFTANLYRAGNTRLYFILEGASTLGASLLRNLLKGQGINRAGKGRDINRADEGALATKQDRGILRAGYGRRSSKMDF